MQDNKRQTEDGKRKQEDNPAGKPDVSGIAGRESLIIEGGRPSSKDALRDVSPGAAEDADAAEDKR